MIVGSLDGAAMLRDEMTEIYGGANTGMRAPSCVQAFVQGDPEHPMLPPGPGLYYLAEPRDVPLAVRVQDCRTSSNASMSRDSDSIGSGGGNGSGNGGGIATGSPAAARGKKKQAAGRQAAGRVPASARDALMELMDCPHPLVGMARVIVIVTGIGHASVCAGRHG